jgi:hypothetical protein
VKHRDRAREAAPKYADTRQLLTYEDYSRLPSDVRYELVEGVLRMTPSPSPFHQEVLKRLGRILMEQVEDRAEGRVCYAPLDVVLSRHDVVQPDLFVISAERLGIIAKANVQGPPDLVIEVLSQSTADWDRFSSSFMVSPFWTAPNALSSEVYPIPVSTISQTSPSAAKTEKGTNAVHRHNASSMDSVFLSAVFIEYPHSPKLLIITIIKACIRLSALG